jgi:hypothetical protein
MSDPQFDPRVWLHRSYEIGFGPDAEKLPIERMEPEHFAAVTNAMMALRRANAAELFALDLDHVVRFGHHIDALEDPEARAAIERDALAATSADAREDRDSEEAERLTEQFRERYAEAGIDGAMQLAVKTFGASIVVASTRIEEVCRGHMRFVFKFGGFTAERDT